MTNTDSLAEATYWESSSSAGAEESWFTQYIDREPQKRRMVQDKSGFQALLSEHDSMYMDYVRIGKHIEDFKRCVMSAPILYKPSPIACHKAWYVVAALH